MIIVQLCSIHVSASILCEYSIILFFLDEGGAIIVHPSPQLILFTFHYYYMHGVGSN